MANFSITVKPMFGDEFRDSGVVHDIAYHTWSREANVAYINQLGIQPAEGIPSPVYMETVYSSPLLMSEEATVYFRVAKIGRSSITYVTQINEARSGRAIATITLVVVVIDKETKKAVPIPEENKKVFFGFEGEENVEVK